MPEISYKNSDSITITSKHQMNWNFENLFYDFISLKDQQKWHLQMFSCLKLFNLKLEVSSAYLLNISYQIIFWSFYIANEPWPGDVKLFQPFEVEQVLIHDNSNILAVQGFLNMCNLEYTIEMRANAEHMSPSGMK